MFFSKNSGTSRVVFLKKPALSPIYAQDPYYDKVALLLDFENGLKDESKYNHAITTFGPAVTASDAKFGTKSLSLNGNGQYIEILNSNGAFNFGDQDFIIECWIKSPNWWYYMPFLFFLDSNNNAIHYFGGRFSAGPGNGGSTVFTDINNNGYSLFNIFINGYNGNAWYHYAVVRKNNKFYFYIDGILKNFSNQSGQTVNFLNINNSLKDIDKIWINKSTFGPGGYLIDSLMDNLRITVGHARYDYPNNFVPEDFEKYIYTPPVQI
jgi:hypothetical protein